MSSQVTLTLPDDVLRRAEFLARHAGRPVADVLTEAIDASLRPLNGLADGGDLTSWSDEAVLAAADATMAPAEDRRQSELLNRQQAGTLSRAERAELAVLMQDYQEGQLRKALARVEAVRRGLREPLGP